LDRIEHAFLSINYRTPQEVMTEAEPVIRAALPDANVPISIRSNGLPVVHGPAGDLDSILQAWLAAQTDGIGCVIRTGDITTGDPVAGGVGTGGVEAGSFLSCSRIRWLTPELSKGLEFDLVVLIDPASFGTGIEGAVDRYVAMTRARKQLVILTNS
ncbi:MAG: AAA family ATPase, partial [Nakamurella sp.]